jgi:sulfite exporter TauE/SafE
MSVIKGFVLSRPAIAIRGTCFVLAALTGLALVGFDPDVPVRALAIAAVGAAVFAALAPTWGWPTLSLVLLAAAYATATNDSGSLTRLEGAVVLAAVLGTLHLLFALAAAVPFRTNAQTALFARFRDRLVVVLGVSLPIVAIATGLGTQAIDTPVLQVLGVVAAVAIALLPLALRARAAP